MVQTSTIITGVFAVAAIGAFYLYWQCRNQPPPVAQPPAQAQWYQSPL